MTECPNYSSFTGAYSEENPFIGSAGDVLGKVRYRPLASLSMTGERRTDSLSSSAGKSVEDEFLDSQFESRTIKVPVKAIALAVVLFVLGSVLCVVGGLLLSGLYIDPAYNDRTWPVLFLGLIMFVPGFYHVRIAYYAYHGVPGYDYSDIPDWD